MTRSMLSPVTVVAVVAATFLASGCVQQRRFRFVPATTACFPETIAAKQTDGPPGQLPSLDCRRETFRMAVIEFDEQGRPFDPMQEAVARQLIEREKKRSASGKIITVVYIHGWKNNAGEAPPGAKPKDVEKFQGALLELGARAEQASGQDRAEGDPPAVPVVGIYIAWRGKTLMGPDWFTFTSLWSRRNTANNIGDGPDVARVLDGVIDLTNAGNSNSRVLLIGHSFGARVLEHAIESKNVRLFDAGADTGAVVRPRVDLVLYVNSANDSRLSMARVQELKAAKLRVRHPDYDPKECGAEAAPAADAEARAARCRDYPLLVAITSTGDSATKYLLPLANALNGDSLIPELEKARPPIPTTNTFADPAPSAGGVKRNAAGHMAFLQSHVAIETVCPAVPSPSGSEKTTEALIDDAVRRAVADALGKSESEAERQQREQEEADRRLAEDRIRFDRAVHPVCSVNDANCRFVFRTFGEPPACYQVNQRQPVDGRPPFNDTPFWIMSVEPKVIKDHGDIWNVSFVEMLGQLMAPRDFFSPTSPRVQIRAE